MLRVLCLDIEGGFGGSSRSLFQSVKNLDRSVVSPEVWCAKDGPIVARYRDCGVPVRVMPDMPRFIALPRLSRNLYTLLLYGRAWMRSGDFRRALLKRASEVDLIHLNHEALFGVAYFLKKLHATPRTMHIRTNLVDTIFARRQLSLAARSVDGLVFITDNEETTFRRYTDGAPLPPYAVVHNIAEPLPKTSPHPGIPQDGRLVVGCVSNYSWTRGVDRVVDLAASVKATGRRDVVFVVAGQMSLSRSLPGELGEVARQGGDLSDYAKLKGVGDSIVFLGHVAEPERVYAGIDLLVKPTRESNPWGRDVIEALAAGRPVFSIGTYERFVQSGETGYLQSDFDAYDMAAQILDIASNRDLLHDMGTRAKDRIRRLCSGPERAQELADFWMRIAHRA
ncbi:MAG: glycosyltransferase family 4 protein [Marivibrio sp.]|uniref:glycosyltransferase family 4 protein n=1 Tax=Marivibrio sp. TaxID=2039719 RepID=UPI0032ECB312